MKRTLFAIAFAVVMTAVNAQTIKVAYQKGDTKTYDTESLMTLGIPMQGDMKASAKYTATFTVTNATSKGYTVEMKFSDVAIEGSDEVVNQLVNANVLKTLEKTPAVLELDSKGKIKDVKNSDAVLSSLAEATMATINSTYESHPELEKVMPKSKVILEANDELTKEKLLSYIKEYSVFTLNGENLKSGVATDETWHDFIKVKSTYSVSVDKDSTTINRTAESNMNEDDLKAFVKKQASKMGGGNVSEMIDSQWSQLKAMGLARVDIDSNAAYVFGQKGWLNHYSDNSTFTMMGAKIKVVSTMTSK